MRRRTFIASAGALALACARRGRLAPAPGPQRGIGFDAYRTRPSGDDFAALADLGATHLALFSFGYMRRHTDPVVLRYAGEDTDWSLTDEGLLATGRMARDAGLRVLLLPTLSDFVDGHWRGEVRMDDEDAWQAWFASYGDFLLHYAELADEMRAVGLSVGTELRGTVHRQSEWRSTIASARESFRGWLTYAANWDDYDRVPWWDALDLIGVQAYFELADPGGADDPAGRSDRLREAWVPIRHRLAQVSAAAGKRVLFTEIGYKSHGGATVHPWNWEISGARDWELQASAYEAAFDALWRERWFAGFYWWKWRPDARSDTDYERDFTPQGKPAEAVVRRYYSGT